MVEGQNTYTNLNFKIFYYIKYRFSPKFLETCLTKTSIEKIHFIAFLLVDGL